MTHCRVIRGTDKFNSRGLTREKSYVHVSQPNLDVCVRACTYTGIHEVPVFFCRRRGVARARKEKKKTPEVEKER